ncbi:MAG: GGDEF domain-containing protein, partial [Anaerolineaceae bacterium]|nr:GGDEF domain-containing protein [Anaerolineaceae bacterium]
IECVLLKRQVSIIIFDIDSFKSFNDVYGHIMGDQVITHVAAKIKAAIRDSDIFGRFGGDEFICLFPEIAQDGAIKTVQRIQDILQKNVFVYEGESFPITMSFGISHWQGDQDITMETLIKHADFALLHAKKQGKNCYKLWEDISASEK